MIRAAAFAALMLLASGAQVAAFRQRMLRASGDEGVLFGIEFFNFEALYHRLLDRAEAGVLPKGARVKAYLL